MNGAGIPAPDGLPAGAATVLPDGSPDQLAAALPPGNVVVLGGPGSGKTALLEAPMPRLLARPGGPARLLTSSRQAALASTERLLAALTTAAGGALGCVTWHAFARGLVTSPAVALTGGGPTTVEAARYPAPAEEAEAVARLLRLAHERDGVPHGRMAVLLPSARPLGGAPP